MALTDKNGNKLTLSLSTAHRFGEANLPLGVSMVLTPIIKDENDLDVLDDANKTPIVLLDANASNDAAVLLALNKIEAAIQEYITTKNI